MLSPNSLITALQQAGNAPICSGSTTCWATTSPLAFISAQEASCDSRTMVEKPVRKSEFCISCTMPERDAFTTSRSTASTCMACLQITLPATYSVMPALVAGIHVFLGFDKEGVDSRDKPGHDGGGDRSSASLLPCHDQILPFIHTRGLAGVDHGRAVELVENGRALQRQPDIELLTLVHR